MTRQDKFLESGGMEWKKWKWKRNEVGRSEVERSYGVETVEWRGRVKWREGVK